LSFERSGWNSELLTTKHLSEPAETIERCHVRSGQIPLPNCSKQPFTQAELEILATEELCEHETALVLGQIPDVRGQQSLSGLWTSNTDEWIDGRDVPSLQSLQELFLGSSYPSRLEQLDRSAANSRISVALHAAQDRIRAGGIEVPQGIQRCEPHVRGPMASVAFDRGDVLGALVP
jgi:hypothetical protein